jgi:hypothetical protein
VKRNDHFRFAGQSVTGSVTGLSSSGFILQAYLSLTEVWLIYYGLEIDNTTVGIRPADHVASSIPKTLALTLPTSGGRSVGIVRSRTQATEFVRLFVVARLLKKNTIYYHQTDMDFKLQRYHTVVIDIIKC